MENEVERWFKKLWETKGARFIAANRLELHDKWSTISISLFSVYIISLNLLVLFPEDKRLPIFSDQNITYSTICLSVLIIVISLIFASRNYKLRAHKLHECGRKITGIYDKVSVWKSTNYLPSNSEIERISSEYLDILDKYENHNHIDFLLFQSNNLDDYKTIKCKNLFWLRTKSQFYLQTTGIYILVILLPVVLIVLI